MLNYLASGLAVLGFDSANNREFLSEKYELAKDVDQLVQQLNSLANDNTLRKEIASSNLQRFNEQYSWQVCKNQLKLVYTRL